MQKLQKKNERKKNVQERVALQTTAPALGQMGLRFLKSVLVGLMGVGILESW